MSAHGGRPNPLMDHSTPLIATIVGGLGLAFLFGALASRLRMSPIVGYLIAGVAVGPFTPGFVADQAIANELAEIGVILLMFGVGMHFSFRDLLAVRAIALPGAVVQIGAATLMGALLGRWMGWSWEAGIIFGLALSVASTVVLLRALEERGLVTSERGRIAVGWLIVEDIAMVFALVLLPALGDSIGTRQDGASAGCRSAQSRSRSASRSPRSRASSPSCTWSAAASSRACCTRSPRSASSSASPCSRSRSASLSARRSCSASPSRSAPSSPAWCSANRSSRSARPKRACRCAKPLRCCSSSPSGMLFDPGVMVREPLALLATLFIVLVGKSVAAFAIVLLFRHTVGVGMTIAASLSQIGEFSFILAGLGVAMGLLPEQGRDLVLAAAMISIVLNPFAFALTARLQPMFDRPGRGGHAPADRRTPHPGRLRARRFAGRGRARALRNAVRRDRG